MIDEREVVEVRDAATVLLVRPAVDDLEGLEVLLMRRSLSASFLPGAYVFPGGALDASDADPAYVTCSTGIDDETANRVTGSQRGTSKGRGLFIAAARELFEEAGILLADSPVGPQVRQSDDFGPSSTVESRRSIHDGNVSFAAFLTDNHRIVDCSRLVPWGRWITPLGSHRRFDARFFVALCPSGAVARADESETIEARWMTPTAALAAASRRELVLITPTRCALESLIRYPNIVEVTRRNPYRSVLDTHLR